MAYLDTLNRVRALSALEVMAASPLRSRPPRQPARPPAPVIVTCAAQSVKGWQWRKWCERKAEEQGLSLEQFRARRAKRRMLSYYEAKRTAHIKACERRAIR